MQSTQKGRKARLAIFLGYTGDELNGMQWQKESHVKTVENQLINKLHAQGFLRTNVFVELVKLYKWSRAARTDKGVHALINGVACVFTVKNDYWVESEQSIQASKHKLEKIEGKEDESLQQIKAKHYQKYRVDKQKLLNVFRSLFSQFTIYCIKQVSGRFDMRQAVKTRTYCYLCPLFMFKSNNPDAEKLSKQETIEKINRLCNYFIGTRNYHNYSQGIKAKDPSAKRYMISMKCEQTDVSRVVSWQNGPTWINFTLHGQSFIYHQIRKMIGMIMQVFLFGEPQNMIENTFFNNQYKILLAPPDGLYLQSLRFDTYNKYEDTPEKLQFDAQKDMLQVMRLKIQNKIIESEKTHDKFTEWLNLLHKGALPEHEQPADITLQQ